MFVLQKKYDEAIKQRNEAAQVAAQLHEEKQTFGVLLGAALKKLGGRLEVTHEEIIAEGGAFAISRDDEGNWTLEIVVPKEAAAMKAVGVVGSIGPDEGRR